MNSVFDSDEEITPSTRSCWYLSLDTLTTDKFVYSPDDKSLPIQIFSVMLELRLELTEFMMCSTYPRFTASDNSVASARFIIFSPNALIFLSVVIKIVFDKSVDNLPSTNNYWYSSIVVFKTDKSE